MKRFYLLRHEDLHGHAGLGVVAEGVIFDDGTGSFTWLTPIKTVTNFWKVTEVIGLHGHEGRTEIIIEGQDVRFDWCVEQAKLKKDLADRKMEKAFSDKKIEALARKMIAEESKGEHNLLGPDAKTGPIYFFGFEDGFETAIESFLTKRQMAKYRDYVGKIKENYRKEDKNEKKD